MGLKENERHGVSTRSPLERSQGMLAIKFLSQPSETQRTDAN